MRAYATDSNERQKMIFGLAVLTIGAAWVFFHVLAVVHLDVRLRLKLSEAKGVCSSRSHARNTVESSEEIIARQVGTLRE